MNKQTKTHTYIMIKKNEMSQIELIQNKNRKKIQHTKLQQHLKRKKNDSESKAREIYEI